MTPNPDGNTTIAFEVVGEGQKCADAILTPLRRRLSEENGNFSTAEECYNYYGYELGYEVPFFFTLEPKATGTNCYCCETCYRERL